MKFNKVNKSMRQILIVLLALLIVGNKAQKPILTYLNYLKNEGYYDLIYQIKCQFGDDIAIAFCEALVDSPQSEEIVRVYMNSCIKDQNHNDFKEFIYKEENMNILLKSLSPNEIERLVKKYEAIKINQK